MSNSEVAPKATELLDSLPDGLNTWYLSNQASSSNPWEFSVGELYGCVCHRAFHELARPPMESNPITGLQLPEQPGAVKPRVAGAVVLLDVRLGPVQSLHEAGDHLLPASRRARAESMFVFVTCGQTIYHPTHKRMTSGS